METVVSAIDLEFCPKSATCKNFCPHICDENCEYEPKEYTIEYEIKKVQEKLEEKPFRMDDKFAWKVYSFVNDWKNGAFGIIPLDVAIKTHTDMSYIITRR